MSMKKYIVSLAVALAIYPVKLPLAATFGEKMERAGMNTLLGMGTVFLVLIFISLIISCFNLIPKAQQWFKTKGEVKVESEVKSIREEVNLMEEPSIEDKLQERADIDNEELVAVIAAAIATLEGVSTEDFVVRSIKKRNNWNKA